MIKALDMVNQINQAKNWKILTTLEVSPLPLESQKTLQALNHVGQMLGRFIYWRFLHTRGNIRTVPAYSTGTVQATNGSNQIVGDSTIWTPDMVGRAFKVNGFEELYRITAVTSIVSLTIDQLYNGDSKSDAGYVIAQDRYKVPEDFDLELGVFNFKDPRRIDIVNPERFDEHRFSGRTFGSTVALTTDTPTVATFETDGDGHNVLVVDPFPDEAIMLHFTYYRMLQKLKRDEDFWPFPPYIEAVLMDGALYFLSRDAADDQRALAQLNQFFESRSELAGFTRMADQYTRISPDTGHVRMAARRNRRYGRLAPGINDEWPLGSTRL